METFFRFFWLSKYNHVSKSKIYKDFKRVSYGENFDYSKFLDDVEHESTQYTKVSNPNINDWKNQDDRKIYDSLSALSIFQITQIRSLLLSLIVQLEKKLVAHKDVIQILEKMENFHFKYSAVCSLPTNILEKKYSSVARQLRNSSSVLDSKKALKKIIEFYSEKVPEYEVFLQEFSELTLSKKSKLIQYIFKKLENNHITTSEISTNLFTIEHIGPQSKKIQGQDLIGNLLPLDKDLNNLCGDKDLEKKILIYQKSNFSLVKLFVKKFKNEKNWDTKLQTEWNKTIAEMAYKIVWNL